ncbi:hypothetical protein R1T40_22155 (plasmid) [Tritonibacter scottomollicae]|uniref:Uncharacterized protein n=1 Tax=Tritonibacter scottomollicae TaxID=483013 RepID=A0ABZ0HLA1_TRISK|nr:hypothetical protein [Tritonibacter scottomollicae]WOI35444.1 hypothetical protein R1T40_22155 [Tritonibacter scottomollicae]
MNMQNTEAKMYIGQPLVFGDMANPQKAGWIVEISPETGRVFTIGAGGMTKQVWRVSIVWEDSTLSKVGDEIASPWIEKAAILGVEAKGADEVAELQAIALEAQERQRQQVAKEREDREQEISDWRDSIRAKVPADAKAVIVAEFEKNESDSMTDYFATSTSKTVILAFSRNTRDMFPEMRKAARNYEQTAYLADAESDAEHREKYSMGAGYYLKASHHYSDGWKISKRRITGPSDDPAAYIPFGEWSVPDGAPFVSGPSNKATPKTDGDSHAKDAGGFTIEEHMHTKRHFQMWVVSPKERASREVFSMWLEKAKERKGWYSRKWGNTPAGFAFKCPEEAQTFADELTK